MPRCHEPNPATYHAQERQWAELRCWLATRDAAAGGGKTSEIVGGGGESPGTTADSAAAPELGPTFNGPAVAPTTI